jgi:tetratricopeptide repeat protein
VSTGRRLVGLLGLVASLSAQEQPREALRPPLPDRGDTNDPAAYIRLAWREVNAVGGDLAVAESALVWAARLDPGSPDPPYMRCVAVMRAFLTDAFRHGRSGGRALRRGLTPDRSALMDSLMHEAWLREPFLDLALDPDLVMGIPPLPKEVRDPVERGFAAYLARDFPLALRSWGEGLALHPDRADLRMHRAYVFYHAGQYDSAAAEVRAMIAMAARADTGLVLVRPSVDMFYYALGLALENAGDTAGAKVAYGQALTENLGLWIVHVRLGNLLLVRGDTAGALAETRTAVDIEPRNAWLAAYYGGALYQAGRADQAVIELRRAVGLNPHYSTPYYDLGVAYDHLHRIPEAFQSFVDFRGHAAAADPRVPWARRRVDALAWLLPDSVAR